MFWDVKVNRDAASFGKTRGYQVHLFSNSGLTTKVGSTPVNRELLVEYLISQNRNTVDSVTLLELDGTTALPTASGGDYEAGVGDTFLVKLQGGTATQGYEQFEQFVTLPSSYFRVAKVESTYSASAGTDASAPTKIYADGCGWENDTTDDGTSDGVSYLECNSVGKYGGQTTTVTYTVSVLPAAAGKSIDLSALLYDFSGSSFHYNSDFGPKATVVIDSATPSVPASDIGVIKEAFDDSGNKVDFGTAVTTFDSTNPVWFVITVRNFGSSAVTGVSVEDVIPTDYGYANGNEVFDKLNASTTNGTVTVSGAPTITWTGISLGAAGSATDTFKLGIKVKGVSANSVTGDSENTACASYAYDTNPANNCGSVNLQYDGAQPDLAIAKTVAPSQTVVGDTVTFTLTASNLSTTTGATSVVVTDSLPAGYTFSPTSQTGFTHSSGTVTWNVGNLAAGTSTSASFTATIDDPASTNASDYLNTATITSTASGFVDPTPGNNTASASAEPSFLKIVKTGDNTLTEGGTGAYELQVSKVGNLDSLTSITVTDYLPAPLTVASILSTGWDSCTSAGTPAVVTCTITDADHTGLGAGTPSMYAYPPITVNVNVATSSAGDYQNRAEVISQSGKHFYSDELDITISSVTYTVVATAGTGGSASCDTSPVSPGGASTCTAVPSTGYVFIEWTGSCAGEGEVCALTSINADKASNAVFAPTYTVVATSSPAAGGSASCTPSPVVSGDDSVCTASPASGYVFTGWSGSCSAETGTSCSLTNITENKSSVANFALQAAPGNYLVTATVDPIGGGTAVCTPDQVGAGGSSDCVATAAQGYRFVNWSGDCSSAGTNTTCSLSAINVNKASIAHFIAVHQVTATADPSGGGSASCTPSSVDDGGSSSCTAVPSSGYRFDGWTGACASETGTTCSLSNVTSDLASVAKFSLLPVSVSLVKAVYETGNGSCATANSQFVYANALRDPVDLTWCFTVENTGSAELANPVIADADLGISNVGQLSLSSGTLPLQPGDTLVFTYDETGRTTSLDNTATVTMDSPTGSGDVSDTATARFAYVFDPPFGLKTGTLQGANTILWTMVWINDSPVSLDNVVITDTIASSMSYIPGTLTCAPSGATTLVGVTGGVCNDADNFPSAGQLSITANFGPDLGATDAPSAANELVISFEATIVDTSTAQTLVNQGQSSWDPDGPGGSASPIIGDTDSDAATSGKQPSQVQFAPVAPATPVPVAPWQFLGLMALMLGWMGYAARRRAV